LNLTDRFSKNTQIPNFMKTHAVAAEFFHADGQIDRQTERKTKLIVGFFANAPKISVHSDINFPQSLLDHQLRAFKT
jgi:hypothetical protein